MQDNQHEQEFSLKSLIFPLTTFKAINIIIFVGLLVFGNVLFNGFVWDDNLFIINNPDVHTLNIAHLFTANKFNAISYYRPVSAVYFAFLYSIFGTNAFFYHFMQIALHIINVILVYILVRNLFQRIDLKSSPLKIEFSNLIILFLSLVFLVHPINVESVAYIAASQSELLFLFGILALLISIKKSIATKQLILVSILLLLSILTKEVGILFLFMVLLFQFLFNRQRFLKFFYGQV
ncbi:hypothetical protein HZA75_02535 [Candidatus Roizmanbacteria bacterium]|nr:hypothetical protein [Candidatus Roizmanbacteria bacterium]